MGACRSDAVAFGSANLTTFRASRADKRCHGEISNASNEEWAFVAPYLTLLPEDAGFCEASVHDLRVLSRWAAGRDAPPTAAILDSRTVQLMPESQLRVGLAVPPARS